MGSNADEVVTDEDQNVPTYVGSLLVPNVRHNRLEVPERYIRNAEEMPKSTVMNRLSVEFPSLICCCSQMDKRRSSINWIWHARNGASFR